MASGNYRAPIEYDEIARLAEAHAQAGNTAGEFRRMRAILYCVLVSGTDKGTFAMTGQVDGATAWGRGDGYAADMQEHNATGQSCH